MIPLNRIPEIENRARLERARRAISANAYDAHAYRLEREHVQRELDEFERANPTLADRELARTTTSWMWLWYVIAALGLDTVLSSSIAQELTGGWGAMALQFIIPILLVTIEVIVSILRYQQQAAPSPFASASRPLLTFFGVGMALVMPLLVLATRIAQYLSEENPSPAFTLVIGCTALALTALSLVLHGLLLANGKQLYEAKMFLVGTFRLRSLQNRIRRQDRAYNGALRMTWDAVVAYDPMVRQLQPSERLAFDATTRQVLDEIQRQGDATAPSARANAPGNGGGDDPQGATAPPPPGHNPADDEVRP